MSTSKAGQRPVLQPIPGEVWVPIDFELIKPTDGYFISTMGRVAKLHAGPNPYSGEAWVVMLGATIVQGEAGLVVQFDHRRDGIRYKKRYMLTPLFARCFIGSEFEEVIKEFCKKVPKDSAPNISYLGNIPKRTLIRKENILDEAFWPANPDRPYNIWPYPLGEPTAEICEAHRKYRDQKSLFCNPIRGEFRDATGLVWRPIILQDVSEVSSYWISATGVIVQYPESMSGPNSMTDTAVQVGVNCKMVSPLQSANGVLYLKNTQGTYSLKSLKKLVYNIFIDPEYDGQIQTVLPRESAFCGTNVLVPAKF